MTSVRVMYEPEGIVLLGSSRMRLRSVPTVAKTVRVSPLAPASTLKTPQLPGYHAKRTSDEQVDVTVAVKTAASPTSKTVSKPSMVR